jgi:hypothetical protein
MKIKFQYIIFVLSLTLILSNSCRKSIFNYRHKFIGNWYFTTIHSIYSPPGYPSDTSYYHGKISYSGTHDAININYYLNTSISLGVDGKGNLYSGDKTIGKIEHRKKLTFSISSISPGATFTTTITGEKE